MLADFLGDPKKALGFLEIFSPTDCDNAPIAYTLAIDPGETLTYAVGSPAGFIAINTSVYYDVSSPGVVDLDIYLDGKKYISLTAGKATAGGMNIELFGWVPATNILYVIKNTSASSITIFVVSYGAYLNRSIWTKIEAVLKDFGKQLATEGKVG